MSLPPAQAPMQGHRVRVGPHQPEHVGRAQLPVKGPPHQLDAHAPPSFQAAAARTASRLARHIVPPGHSRPRGQAKTMVWLPLRLTRPAAPGHIIAGAWA